MVQFAQAFPDAEIVASLMRQLSWTHFLQLLPLKTEPARHFYARQCMAERWSVRELHRQIERKAFERSEIASAQGSVLTAPSACETAPAVVFKDPYFLDFLGLRQGHDEADLETATLRQLEAFILELGRGFAFVERQKRMVIDGDDFYLDLLFFHRRLRRLVAIELKLGRFKAAHKGQMELYRSGQGELVTECSWRYVRQIMTLPPSICCESNLGAPLRRAHRILVRRGPRCIRCHTLRNSVRRQKTNWKHWFEGVPVSEIKLFSPP